jgi:glycosyltransferase involved in cell wall biosynthesis
MVRNRFVVALEPGKTTLSVALCTYNGERYLPEQLASIAAQTEHPDEVVIVDDGSSDGSLGLVQHWANDVPFPVHIDRNPTNLGSTKSFEKALSLCTGDLIMLSDQDDVWYPDRLAKSKAWLAQNPNMDAVFSDADLIDSNSQLTGQRIWDLVQFTPEAQQQWRQGLAHELLFSGYLVTGATLTIRRSLLPSVIPFPTHVQYLIHDAWISLVVALKGKIGFIAEPLIRYRQHASQQVGFQSGGPRVTLTNRFQRSRAERMDPILKKSHRYSQLSQLLNTRQDLDSTQLKRLNRMAAHLYRRTTLPEVRLFRVPYVMTELVRGNYQLFQGHWWLTALGDLFEQ